MIIAHKSITIRAIDGAVYTTEITSVPWIIIGGFWGFQLDGAILIILLLQGFSVNMVKQKSFIEMKQRGLIRNVRT